jgi:hypothetical protein
MDFKEATDVLSVPLEQIAAAIGKTYGTVLAYRTGTRVPPPEVQRRLAMFIREHSAALDRVAEELEALQGKD